jgi:hypothetical protein
MSWLQGGRLPGPQRSPAVKRAPSKAQKAAGALFLPMSGTINPVVRSLRLQWPQAGRPFWQMELAPPLAGPFALRLTLHHHRRKLPEFALHTVGERTKAPIAGPLRPLSPRWAVARSPGGHAGALAFCHAGRGAVRLRTTPLRRGSRRTFAPQRSFLPDFVERYVGFRAYLYAPTRLTGRAHAHAS